MVPNEELHILTIHFESVCISDVHIHIEWFIDNPTVLCCTVLYCLSIVLHV